MTPEELEHERLAGPRALTFGCLAGIIFWGVLLFGIASGAFAATFRLFLPAVAHGGGAQYQACAYQPHFPVRLRITPGVDPAAWRAAIAEWNSHAPGAFVEGEPADATIEPTTGRTWVRMGMCLGGDTIVYSGSDLRDWAAHELGHVLALRDWVPAGYDTTGYINPGRCPGEYAGLMSYCGNHQWNSDDDAMIRSLS